jgi:hypothetical protein
VGTLRKRSGITSPDESWFPQSVEWPGSKKDKALRAARGGIGALVWDRSLLYAEDQPARRRGTFTYTSDDDCLDRLNLEGTPLVDNQGRSWTLDDLWKTTGQLKMTRKRRVGDRTKIEICDWEQWKQNHRRQRDAARRRRSRAENDADAPRTASGRGADKQETRRGQDADPTTTPTESVTPPPASAGDAGSLPGGGRGSSAVGETARDGGSEDGGGESFAVRKAAETLLGNVEIAWALTPEQAASLAELSITRALETDLAPAGNRAPELVDAILADPPGVVSNPAGLLRTRARQAAADVAADAIRQKIADCPTCSNGWVLKDDGYAVRCPQCNLKEDP